MKKNNKPDLSALQHADMQTIERISAHTPAAGKGELNKIYTASERKYQSRKHNTYAAADSETYDVAVMPHTPLWKRSWAAVACLLVFAGTFGGLYALNRQFHPVPEDMTAEVDSIEENADRTVTPEEDENAPLQVPGLVKDNSQAAAPVMAEASPENADAAQAADDVQGTDAWQGAEKTDAKTPAKTEDVPVETQAPTESPASWFVIGEATYDANGHPIIPGFTVTDFPGSSAQDIHYGLIAEVRGSGEPTIWAPQQPVYVPDGLNPFDEYSKIFEKNYEYDLSGGLYSISYETWYETLDDNSRTVIAKQWVKRYFVGAVSYDKGQVIPVTIDGRPGYLSEEWDEEYHYFTAELVWDRGDFIFQISTARNDMRVHDSMIEEMAKMLLSMAPRDTSGDPVVTDFPEIPGFTVNSGYLSVAQENFWKITFAGADGTPDDIQTQCKPAYIPEGLIMLYYQEYLSGTAAYYESLREYGLPIYQYEHWINSERNGRGGFLYGSNGRFTQIDKDAFYLPVFFKSDDITLTPMTVGGRSAFLMERHHYNGRNNYITYTLVWDGGDYIYSIQLEEPQDEHGIFPENWLDEIVKMAESVQPAQ